jgi:hypothetical protein
VSGLDDLLGRDLDARRCLRVFTDRSGWELDDLLACYGSADLAAAVGIPFEEPDDDRLLAAFSALVGDDVEERYIEQAPEPGVSTDGLDETDRRWYAELTGMTSPERSFEGETEPESRTTEFGPPPDVPAERVLVPEGLAASIDESYAVVSHWGFATDKDLADWLAEATGC